MTDLISPELAAAELNGQPYAYRRADLVEPDWTRMPGYKDVTAEEWRSVQWQRSHCVKNVKQLRDVMGDLLEERVYEDLTRDQAERATMSMLLPPQMLNTIVPNGSRRLHRGVLRRPGPPLHAADVHRPPHGLAVAPARDARLAARARDVGHGGVDPPVPDQGAGGDPADLSAVLRALHPDGPGRELDAGDRQAEVHDQAAAAAGRHARLPAPHPGRPRRGGVGWRRGEHALAAARVVPDQPAGDREHPRHPAGHQGADGDAAALAVRRRPGRRRAGRHARPEARRHDRDAHPRERRPVGDAAGGRGDRRRCSRPACATSATRAC